MSEQDIRYRRNKISEINFRLNDAREELRHAERDLEEARWSERSDDEELLANLESDVQAIESETSELESELSDHQRELESLEAEH